MKVFRDVRPNIPNMGNPRLLLCPAVQGRMKWTSHKQKNVPCKEVAYLLFERLNHSRTTNPVNLYIKCLYVHLGAGAWKRQSKDDNWSIFCRQYMLIFINRLLTFATIHSVVINRYHSTNATTYLPHPSSSPRDQ